jgi:hypothetical protein
VNTIDWKVLLPLLITAVIAVCGWYAAHRMSMSRDRMNKRRELRVKYLIDAYRLLETVSNRPISSATAPQFESAIADIQLFGTPTQVLLAQDFATAFAASGSAPLDHLLENLREDLRAELELAAVPARIKFLRITLDDFVPQIRFASTVGEQLDSLTEDVRQLEEQATPTASALLDSATLLGRWELIVNAPISPTERILAASVFLERSLLQASVAAGIKQPSHRVFLPRRIAQQLAEEGALSQDDLSTFRSLYDIRNRLVHETGAATDADATRFLDLVWRFVRQLTDKRGA